MKNKWLFFFSQVAFICNICFLIIAFVPENLVTNTVIKSTIVILGFMSFFLNIVLQACLAIFRILKKEVPVKPWLRIANLAIFVVEIIRYFIIQGN